MKNTNALKPNLVLKVVTIISCHIDLKQGDFLREKKKPMHQLGIKPGSIPWQGITTRPLVLDNLEQQ